MIEIGRRVIEIGKRVSTPLGPGEVVGYESFYGGKTLRYIVRIDDPSRWAFGHESDTPYIFEREVKEI